MTKLYRGSTICKQQDPLQSNYMPPSNLITSGAGWGCAQRRQLRALSHVLLLYDPKLFILVVDDDTFVNTGLLYEYNHGMVWKYIKNQMHREVLGDVWNINHNNSFIFGGAGFLIGRDIIKRLQSMDIYGPIKYSDSFRNPFQMNDLSILKLAYEGRGSCDESDPSCVKIITNNGSYTSLNSIATSRLRLIDICRNLLSSENTCYHSDHALSICLIHGAYADVVHAICDISPKPGRPRSFSKFDLEGCVIHKCYGILFSRYLLVSNSIPLSQVLLSDLSPLHGGCS